MLIERFTAVHTRAGISSPPNQDVVTMGIHFGRRTSVEGSTATGLDSTLRSAVEARWDTFELAWKVYRPPTTVLDTLVWHDAWPAGSPPHKAVRTTARTSAGTFAGAASLPHQISCNLTLESSNRRHWGRIALGPLGASSTIIDANGVMAGAFRTAIATAWAAFLNGCLTDGVAPVVYRRPSWSDPARSNLLNGGSFYPAIGYRVDDILDVVRRRRLEHATAANRLRADLTVPAASPAVYAGPYDDVVG